MQLPDMNLLVALDALLGEGSVVGAARRMNLSPTAMFALPDSDLILPVPKEALLSVRRLGLKSRSFILPQGWIGLAHLSEPQCAVHRQGVCRVGGGDFDWLAGGEPGV